MKRIAFVIAAAVFCLAVGAQARAEDVRREWTQQVRSTNETGNTSIADVIVRTDQQGNVYVTGAGQGYRTIYQTVKYDRDGNQLWIRYYRGYGTAYPHAMSVDNAGNVYVTGSSYNPSYLDIVTIKYDMNGNTLWTAVYAGASGSNDIASFISKVDDQGNIYVAGSTLGSTYPQRHDYVVIKYDAAGNQVWADTYNGGTFTNSNGQLEESTDYANTLVLDPAGNVYVAGGTSVQGAVIIKYDPQGARQWTRSAPDVGGYIDYWPIMIGLDREGNIYLAGTTWTAATDRDYIVRKFTPDGNDIWARTFNSSVDICLGMQVSPAGNIYLMGSTGPNASSYGYGVVKYDADGNELWNRIHYAYGVSAWAKAMAVDQDDSVYVTGRNGTVKYDAAGLKVWTMAGDLGNTPYSITLDSSANVVVAGFSFGGAYWPGIITEKYSQPSMNKAPIAAAGPDQVIECAGPAGSTVTLDGAASTDPNNDPLTYSWREGAVLFGTGRVLTVTLPLGVHAITLTVEDGRGGTGTDEVVITVRDTTPPVSMLNGTAGDAGENGWYRSAVTVMLLATDACSGVRDIRSSVDGGPEAIAAGATATVTITSDGLHALSYFAKDEAGNAETPANTMSVKIDQTAPTILATVAPAPNGTGWHSTDVTVTFACSDALSGIASCPAPITVTTEGAGQTIIGTAVDNAGNSADSTLTLNIDKTPPSIPSLSTSPGMLWPPNHKMVDVLINGSAADYGSDVASIVISVTDEYGVYNMTGLAFGGTIQLEAWREGTDRDGRQYTITAVATDKAGNASTATTAVMVPHDMR